MQPGLRRSPYRPARRGCQHRPGLRPRAVGATPTGVRDRVVATLILLPIAVATVASFARLVGEGDDVPADDDIAAACVFARDAAGDDGAIVILPPWSVRPLLALGPAAARVVASDGPAAALLARRHARVIAVVEPGGDPWRATLVPLGRPRSTRTFGAVSVQTFDGGGPARFDALNAFASAQVDVDGVACDERVDRGAVIGVRCPGAAAALRVTREHALVSENGRLVVRLPTPAFGQRIAVRFDHVPLGDHLVVAAGHTRSGAERGRATAVDVVIDDTVVATLRRAPSFFVEPSRAALRAAFVRPAAQDGEGFRADVVDTRAFSGGTHRLAFVVAADGSDGRVEQDFALDAFVPGATAAGNAP